MPEKPVKKRRRYIVEHIWPSQEMGVSVDSKSVAPVLELIVNTRQDKNPVLENARLVSLVPAGVDQPPDWYLATWEVFE